MFLALQGNGIRDSSSANQLLQQVNFNGLTPLGTNLNSKVSTVSKQRCWGGYHCWHQQDGCCCPWFQSHQRQSRHTSAHDLAMPFTGSIEETSTVKVPLTQEAPASSIQVSSITQKFLMRGFCCCCLSHVQQASTA